MKTPIKKIIGIALIMGLTTSPVHATVTIDASLSLNLAPEITTVAATNLMALPSGGAVRINPSAALTIDGIVAPTNAPILIGHNASAFPITIGHQVTAVVVPGNRIITDTGAAIIVPGGSSFVLHYDTTAARWKILGRAGKGITSLNGLEPVTQTLAVGATGTAPAFVSSGSTHTLNIPLAGTTITSGTISDGAQTIVGAKTLSGATVLSGGVTVTCTGCITDTNVVDGLTISGGTINNTSVGATTPLTGAFTTLTSTGVSGFGNNTATVAIDSSDWDITPTGVMTGIGNITTDGAYTQSGTGVNMFTGATTISGEVTLSAAGTALTVTNNALISGAFNVTGVGTFAAQAVLSAGASTAGNFVPSADNTQALGTGDLRFASVRAVSITSGDHHFADKQYGDWTAREGFIGFYFRNNTNGKYYRLPLVEIAKSKTSFWAD
jgi:hypothetical protein